MYEMLRCIFLFVFSFAGSFCFAQTKAVASVNVKIVSPVGFTKIQDLSFNNIRASGASRIKKLKRIEGQGFQPALFNLSVDSGVVYDLSVNAKPIELVHVSGKMILEDFTSSYTLNKEGDHFLNISAVLSVLGTFKSGSYTAKPLHVTVNYN